MWRTSLHVLVHWAYDIRKPCIRPHAALPSLVLATTQDVFIVGSRAAQHASWSGALKRHNAGLSQKIHHYNIRRLQNRLIQVSCAARRRPLFTHETKQSNKSVQNSASWEPSCCAQHSHCCTQEAPKSIARKRISKHTELHRVINNHKLHCETHWNDSYSQCINSAMHKETHTASPQIDRPSRTKLSLLPHVQRKRLPQMQNEIRITRFWVQPCAP